MMKNKKEVNFREISNCTLCEYASHKSTQYNQWFCSKLNGNNRVFDNFVCDEFKKVSNDLEKLNNYITPENRNLSVDDKIKKWKCKKCTYLDSAYFDLRKLKKQLKNLAPETQKDILKIAMFERDWSHECKYDRIHRKGCFYFSQICHLSFCPKTYDYLNDERFKL